MVPRGVPHGSAGGDVRRRAAQGGEANGDGEGADDGEDDGEDEDERDVEVDVIELRCDIPRDERFIACLVACAFASEPLIASLLAQVVIARDARPHLTRLTPRAGRRPDRGTRS